MTEGMESRVFANRLRSRRSCRSEAARRRIMYTSTAMVDASETTNRISMLIWVR